MIAVKEPTYVCGMGYDPTDPHRAESPPSVQWHKVDSHAREATTPHAQITHMREGVLRTTEGYALSTIEGNAQRFPSTRYVQCSPCAQGDNTGFCNKCTRVAHRRLPRLQWGRIVLAWPALKPSNATSTVGFHNLE